jgi:hypothetical protein
VRRNSIGLTVAALTAAGVVGVAGAAIAGAADDSTSTSSPSSSTDSLPPGGEGSTDQQMRDGRGGPGGSQDEAVTGDEAQQVIDAVEAQDSSATIDSVRKDPDGSYDALGTKDDQPVMYDVSADLATITEHAGGPGGHGGRGPSDADGGSTTSSDPTDANTAASV